MLQPILIRHCRSRRGVAIMIAISILAILTIIGFALAATVDFSGQENKQSALRHEAQSVAWFGLDTAKILLAKTPDEILGKSKTLTLDNGTCAIVAASAKADAAYYANSAFKLRPGDIELSLIVTLQKTVGTKKSEPLVRNYSYLVNVAPGTERVIVLPPTVAAKNSANSTVPSKDK